MKATVDPQINSPPECQFVWSKSRYRCAEKAYNGLYCMAHRDIMARRKPTTQGPAKRPRGPMIRRLQRAPEVPEVPPANDLENSSIVADLRRQSVQRGHIEVARTALPAVAIAPPDDRLAFTYADDRQKDYRASPPKPKRVFDEDLYKQMTEWRVSDVDYEWT